METIFIGNYIRQRRRELNLTQEQLCAGICDPATLSRIETGHQTPTRARLNALLQRLGLPDTRYYAIVSKNELEIEALKKEITACNILDRVDEGFEKLAQLEELAEPDDTLTLQFILRTNALLGRLDGRYSQAEQLELLLRAICLTIPQFQMEAISSFLYTFEEAKIINHIAGIYSNSDQLEKAIFIYEQLLNYIRLHYQEILTENGLLPLVLHNYARALALNKQYRESIRIAEDGWQSCIRYGHHQFLPGYFAIMGECYHFIGDDIQSKKFYTFAYYLYNALGNKRNLSAVVKESKEYISLEFEF